MSAIEAYNNIFMASLSAIEAYKDNFLALLSPYYPEKWLACPCELYETNQPFPLICIFNISLRGYWLAIVWSLIFLAWTLRRRTRLIKDQSPSTDDALDLKPGTPTATSEESFNDTWRALSTCSAIHLLIFAEMYMVSYVVSATGWRLMILEMCASPPSAMSLSISMGSIGLLAHALAIRNDEKMKSCSAPVLVKLFAITGLKTSSWIIVAQTALYLSMLNIPGVHRAFTYILTTLFCWFGICD